MARERAWLSDPGHGSSDEEYRLWCHDLDQLRTTIPFGEEAKHS